MARSKPYVILNAAMTLDGKIATASGDSRISSGKDLERVRRLRGAVDAILVGINTVLVDDPMLTVRGGERGGGRSDGSGGKRRRNPVRVILDSRARIAPGSRIMRSCDRVPTIIACSERASRAKLGKIRARGAVPIVLGRKRIDMARLMSYLKKKGVRRLLVEGGGEINWSLLSRGLADEVIVTVAPRIVGGSRSITLVDGAGFPKIQKGIKLRLERITKNKSSETVLFYKVL